MCPRFLSEFNLLPCCVSNATILLLFELLLETNCWHPTTMKVAGTHPPRKVAQTLDFVLPKGTSCQLEVAAIPHLHQAGTHRAKILGPHSEQTVICRWTTISLLLRVVPTTASHNEDHKETSLAFYLAYILASFFGIYIFWHSFWHIPWHMFHNCLWH